jgi:hypothetical protein
MRLPKVSATNLLPDASVATSLGCGKSMGSSGDRGDLAVGDETGLVVAAEIGDMHARGVVHRDRMRHEELRGVGGAVGGAEFTGAGEGGHADASSALLRGLGLAWLPVPPPQLVTSQVARVQAVRRGNSWVCGISSLPGAGPCCADWAQCASRG